MLLIISLGKKGYLGRGKKNFEDVFRFKGLVPSHVFDVFFFNYAIYHMIFVNPIVLMLSPPCLKCFRFITYDLSSVHCELCN